MLSKANEHIREAIDLAGDLTKLADVGEADGTDDGCAVLFGVVRDCAYRIRGRAEQEREAHRSLGRWDGNGDLGNQRSKTRSGGDGSGARKGVRS